MYGEILDMKGSTLDLRWTYFQAPIQVEDLLGHKFPVPSEYDFSLLQAIIQHRFKDDGEVGEFVSRGNYELLYSNNSDLPVSTNGCMKPGTQVVMAIIFKYTSNVVHKEQCPLPKSNSRDVSSPTDDSYNWYVVT
jgi:ubiquitin domain-containing protein